MDAIKYLKENHGLTGRVVSMPCFEVFDAQSKEYRLKVLPDGIPSMSVDVMSTLGWERYSHEQFGLNRFGASGPYKDVYKVRTSAQTIALITMLTQNRNSNSHLKVSLSAPWPR